MWGKSKGAALVFSLMLLGCSGSPDTQKAATPEPTHYIGQPVRSDEAEVTITSIETRDGVGSAFAREQASDGGVLVAVRYSVKNVSDKPMPFYKQPQITLIDPNGTEYKPDVGKSGSYATEIDLDQKLMSDLNPGISTNGASVFEIARDRFNPNTWHAVIGGGSGERVALIEAPPTPPAAAPQPAPVTPAAAPMPTPAAEPAPAQPTAPPAPAVQTQAAPSPSHEVAKATVPLPDYSRRERRLRELIDNALGRDNTGETERLVASARAEREHCATAACLDGSYSREEAALRQWDGAEEIMHDPS